MDYTEFKKCPVCNRVFEPDNMSKKYCSLLCNKKASKQKQLIKVMNKYGYHVKGY